MMKIILQTIFLCSIEAGCYGGVKSSDEICPINIINYEKDTQNAAKCIRTKFPVGSRSSLLKSFLNNSDFENLQNLADQYALTNNISDARSYHIYKYDVGDEKHQHSIIVRFKENQYGKVEYIKAGGN